MQAVQNSDYRGEGNQEIPWISLAGHYTHIPHDHFLRELLQHWKGKEEVAIKELREAEHTQPYSTLDVVCEEVM